MSDDVLGMSDEDFLNAPLPSLAQEESSEESEEQEEVEQEQGTLEESEESSEEETEEADELDEEEEETSEEGSEEGESNEELDSKEDSDNTSENTLPEDLQRVLQPFKANGGEMQVKTTDEAIQLMQMGANYTKKMQALQPNLKMVKMLEQQDLLDEGKINFLIDLHKKDPAAIAQLVKDSGVDPLSLEPEEGSEYKPTNYSVPDEAMQLEQVLSDIENTPTYSQCIDVVGNQWDSSSKQVLSQNPVMIKQLNEQMQAGIFDQVNQEVQRLKTFGELSGLSDFEAYKQTGARMYQAGALNQAKPTPVAETKVTAKPQDIARSEKRKAASTPKTSRKKVVKEQFNPLAMSDEEFEKIMQQQLK